MRKMEGNGEMRKVVVACGSGIAISRIVALKVHKLLEQKNLIVPIEAIALKDLEAHLPTSMAYLAIFKPEKLYEIPVIDGTAFLSGIRQDEELEKLIQIIQNEQQIAQEYL